MNDNIVIPEWHSVAYFRIMEKRKEKKQRATVLAVVMALTILIGFLAGFIAGQYQRQRTVPIPISDAADTIDTGWTNSTVTIIQPVVLEEQEEAPSYSFTQQEEYLLAKIAMAEAEDESTAGKALVILTVLNRVDDSQFPNSIQEVIAQKNAFTSYKNGRFDRVEPDEDCQMALAMVESGWDESNGALYFEAKEPGEETWHSRNLRMLFQYGRHTFYAEM